ncbi:Retrovirus-related Pol polyprotein from transposon TNT 1-94 [Quillaja saponaria]|uniref:Retrovirus-related Pol polyprotein from transposon TNT 1-94 n=1 Tax=Quillaja saponaria TaxID=32244 RepID=A0AAD7LVS2_QUISA|nr:Retrovirus-related Pol polyprotein from transposon TNT 1-94 [Quillaja saponaria]
MYLELMMFFSLNGKERASKIQTMMIRKNKISSYKLKKCYRCGKLGHIQRNCRVKLEDGNLSIDLGSNQDEPVEWEKCLSNEVIDDAATSMYSGKDHLNVNSFIDYKKEWIFDSRCTHHLTGNESLLSNAHHHDRNRVIVTADNSVHPVKKEGTKLDPKAKKCIFVGYDQYRKGWRCMDPVTKKFTTSRDVIFDEISPYYSSFQLTSKIIENDDLLTDKVEDFADAQDDSPPLNHDNSKRSGTNDVSEELLPSNSENKKQVALKLRKSNREKKEPAWMKDYTVHGNQGTVTECFFIGPCDSHEPSCFEEARNHPKWEVSHPSWRHDWPEKW